MASARATSRRFCSATVSRPAGSAARRSSPVKRSASPARSVARATCRWRSSAPTITFSSTVMPLKIRTIWKVRAIPFAAIASGGSPAISAPWKRMAPEVGAKKPASELKTVVLPAPFGPMRPAISPSRIVKLTSSLAVSPPKRFVSFSTSRSGALTAPPRRAPAARAAPRAGAR